MALFEGSCVALVTPFHQTGVDFEALEQLLDHQLQNGTDAILICGTTGEPPTMTGEEIRQTIAHAYGYVNNRVPVIAGVGANSTQKTIENCAMAQEIGVDGLLVVTPYYNKATQKGLVQHYQMINDAVSTPIIVYNVPSRTSVNILPETMEQIAQLSQVVALKAACGNISQICEMARRCQGKIDIYSGNDDHIVPVLSCGGKGVISVIANVAPRLTHELVAQYLGGNARAALDIQFAINPLAKALFAEVNPIPVKAAVNLLGLPGGLPRMPLTPAEPATLDKLTREMQHLDLI